MQAFRLIHFDPKKPLSIQYEIQIHDLSNQSEQH